MRSGSLHVSPLQHPHHHIITGMLRFRDQRGLFGLGLGLTVIGLGLVLGLIR